MSVNTGHYTNMLIKTQEQGGMSAMKWWLALVALVAVLSRIVTQQDCNGPVM